MHLKITTPKNFIIAASVCALIVQALLILVIPRAEAATLTDTYLRLNRMKAATATTQRLVFKTPATNSGTEAKIQIQFYHINNPDPSVANNNFILSATQATATAACATETGATAVPGTLAASGDNADTGATRKTITVTGVTDLAVSTSYCIDFTTADSLTNPVNSGQYIVRVRTLTSADVILDDKLVGVRIVDGTTNWDQITVSAVVPPSFSFILSGTTDAFVTLLDTGTPVYTTGRTITIATNASKGWITWVKSANAGLTSPSAPYTITTTGTVDDATSTLVAGTEGYVLDVDLTTDAAGGGAVSLDAEYDGTVANSGGTLSNTAYEKVASANGTANGDIITLKEIAAISGSTPAGDDYTDTLTVIGAGVF